MNNQTKPLVLAAIVFVALILTWFTDPTFAFGRSAGTFNLSVLVIALIFATSAAAILWSWMLRTRRPSMRRKGLYMLLVFISSVVLHAFLISALDSSFDFGKELHASRIHYFCLSHFSQLECVREVNLCPSCALRIDKWERDEMVAKLKKHRSQNQPQLNQSLERQPAEQ